MIPFALVLAGPALGHGGEDHAAPPPPAGAADTSSSIATWSSEFEAVLRLPYEAPGETVHGTLLLADFTTSAPVPAGTATLALNGPKGEQQVQIGAGARPGIWPFDVVLTEGTYTGGLTVITPDRADVLGLPEFSLAAPEAPSMEGVPWGFVAVAAGLGIAVGAAGALLAGAGGVLLRRMVGASILLVVGGATGQVLAHGGEDHGPPTAPRAAASTGAVLRLPLESQFLLEVRTAKALAGPFDERVNALGNAVAPPGGLAEIHAPVTGILSLPAGRVLAPGQHVNAGEPLATISETLAGGERSSVVAGQTEARVRLAEARRELAVAERDAERAQELGGVLSERERLERQSRLDLARQAVVQAEAAASELRSGTPTTVLRAPITGRISTMIARPGDVVSPGDVLFRVVGVGGVWVEARVPEALAGRLVAGAPAIVAADARPDEPIAATVLDPGLEADPASGTLRVTLATDAAPGWLVPGMTVSAAIVSGEVRVALTVPDSAVVDSAGEALVFVKTGPESFEARPVRTGALSADRREILAGVTAGERVVEQGTYVLRSLAGR